MKDKNLYFVLSSEYRKDKDILEIARQAISGGADIIQMREKLMPDEQKVELGYKLAGLCKENNVIFIVNDDPYLAKQVNADGIHLGQTDIKKYPIDKVRKILGKDKIIGLSTHSLEQFKEALKSDFDYLAYGPIFKTQTKNYHIGVSQISEVMQLANVPVVFIGGIGLNNIDIVLSKGAENIAMIRAIMGSENITQTTRQIKEKIASLNSQKHIG